MTAGRITSILPAPTALGRAISRYCATGGLRTLAAKSLQDLSFTNVTAVVMRFDDACSRCSISSTRAAGTSAMTRSFAGPRNDSAAAHCDDFALGKRLPRLTGSQRYAGGEYHLLRHRGRPDRKPLDRKCA